MTRRDRRGFTLIELLVVCGIIGILVGIAVLGYLHFDKVAAERTTTTRLQMCASLLTQCDPAFGLQGIEGPPPATPPLTYLVNGAIVNIPPYPGHPSVGNPGGVTIGGNRFGGAVLNTAVIFQVFARNPDLRTTIVQLPTEAVLRTGTRTVVGTTVGTADLPWTDTTTHMNLTVILDGWKNPIIYVPSGGMSGVYIGGPPPPPAGFVMKSGTILGVQHLVVSVDGKPFWASAGADGNFGTGDDNMYSCPVVYK